MIALGITLYTQDLPQFTSVIDSPVWTKSRNLTFLLVPLLFLIYDTIALAISAKYIENQHQTIL